MPAGLGALAGDAVAVAVQMGSVAEAGLSCEIGEPHLRADASVVSVRNSQGFAENIKGLMLDR